MDREYRFKIANSYTPRTIPMERLAAYMSALARLLGEKPSVHFETVEEGSAVLVAAVDQPARPKVRERVRDIRQGIAPADARKAYHELDDLLRSDGATGILRGDATADILQFPGSTRPEPLRYGPFRQEGKLEGQIVRIGGRDDSIHIHLRDGAVVYTAIETNAEVAKRLGSHLFDPIVRLHGVGTWYRDEQGGWELKRFVAARFEILDDEPLLDVVARLREAPGNDWAAQQDPLGELLVSRHGGGESH